MVKLKAAAAPVNNFTPRKEKEKKKKKKKKNIAIFLGGRIGLSRFLGKILPGACVMCGDFFSKPGGLDLYCPKRGLVLAALSLLDFLFFVGK